MGENAKPVYFAKFGFWVITHHFIQNNRRAAQVVERTGEEVGAEKATRKSIKKASEWKYFCKSVVINICYNFLL